MIKKKKYFKKTNNINQELIQKNIKKWKENKNKKQKKKKEIKI